MFSYLFEQQASVSITFRIKAHLTSYSAIDYIALFPDPIPSFSMLHANKIGESGDKATTDH